MKGSKLDTVTIKLTLDKTFKRRFFTNNFTYLEAVHDQALHRQSVLVHESVVFGIKRASEIDSEISPSQTDRVPTGERNSSLSIQTWHLLGEEKCRLIQLLISRAEQIGLPPLKPYEFRLRLKYKGIEQFIDLVIIISSSYLFH